MGPLVLLDIPLLERSPFLQRATTVIFVDAPEKDRARRVVQSRGWSTDELRLRESHQPDIEERKRQADQILPNPDPPGLDLDPTEQRSRAEEKVEILVRNLIRKWSESLSREAERP